MKINLSKSEKQWFLAIGISVFLLPIFLTQFNWFISFDDTGEIGDTIGGVTAPFLSFFGSILVYLALKSQITANKQIQDQFSTQQFESQFYKMLDMHKANLSEMNISDQLHGRKCFESMFYEFKYVYLTLYKIYEAHQKTYKWNFSKIELSNIAYKVFFFGIGSISNRLVNKVVDEKYHPLLALLIESLNKFQKDYSFSSGMVNRAIPSEDGRSVFDFLILYFPFDGHSTRLGHYYRQLFQTVSYVVNSDVVPERLEKYKYLKMIRAQLSNHEQLLLYYNSLTSFGNEWLTNDYFSTHRMIKNIPLEIADFGQLPKELLGEKNYFGEFIFEWDEFQ